MQASKCSWRKRWKFIAWTQRKFPLVGGMIAAIRTLWAPLSHFPLENHAPRPTRPIKHQLPLEKAPRLTIRFSIDNRSMSYFGQYARDVHRDSALPWGKRPCFHRYSNHPGQFYLSHEFRLRKALKSLDKPIPTTPDELRNYDANAISAYNLLNEVAPYNHLAPQNREIVRQLAVMVYWVYYFRGFPQVVYVLMYLIQLG